MSAPVEPLTLTQAKRQRPRTRDRWRSSRAGAGGSRRVSPTLRGGHRGYPAAVETSPCIGRAGSHVLIRRRTVADDEGMPPLLSTTRARHALPTAGFRFALAQRASGDGRPARAVLVPSISATEWAAAFAFASLRQRRLLELRPMASSRESTSCLCIGCDGFGRVALLLVVLADSRAPARQQRVRRAPRRPHGGTAGWTPRVPEDGRGMPRACPGWW